MSASLFVVRRENEETLSLSSDSRLCPTCDAANQGCEQSLEVEDRGSQPEPHVRRDLIIATPADVKFAPDFGSNQFLSGARNSVSPFFSVRSLAQSLSNSRTF